MIAESRILAPEGGYHNADHLATARRLARAGAYRDLSTICVIPILPLTCTACQRVSASPPPRVLNSWFNLMPPMNQKFIRWMPENMEVGAAYSAAFDLILSHPELSAWKYVLTLEHDNVPPPDGLLRLYESIESPEFGGPYDAVGGLYWTKGPEGQPMCYGRPEAMPKDFRPWLPPVDAVAACNGLGMGFTLFRLSMFRHPDLPRPFFKTLQEYVERQGTRTFTQDLYFFDQAGKLGFRFACDTRVKVGHHEAATDIVW